MDIDFSRHKQIGERKSIHEDRDWSCFKVQIQNNVCTCSYYNNVRILYNCSCNKCCNLVGQSSVSLTYLEALI